MDNSHILKFVNTGQQPIIRGIKTFPRQTYGVSDDSPDHFKQNHTLLGENGYIYKHENNNNFEYFSQKKSFNVHGGHLEEDMSKIQARRLSNPLCFHLKKGRLTQFMDKNVWMSPVLPFMGHERGSKARANSNRDRQNRIKSLKPKNNYVNTTAIQPKNSKIYHQTIGEMMVEKVKIRQNRNQLASEQRPALARTIQHKLDDKQVDYISQKFNKTTLDFYSTHGTFKSLKKSKRNNSMRPSKIPALEQIDKANQNVQEWYRKTCSSKWNYNPKKLDSEELEQFYQTQSQQLLAQ